MSWIEKIQTEFTITCGDGESFRPMWLNANKKVEYQYSEFEFNELAGTLVKRKKPKGRKYGLELFFTGDDHLEIAKAFEASSADERPWTILHPFYGTLVVQPTGLNIDNSVYNVTKITCTVIETIVEDNPKTNIDPIDNITLEKDRLDQTVVESFDAVPSSSDAESMRSTNAKLYREGSKLPLLSEESEAYFNSFNAANAAILNATSEPLQAIRTIQSVINAPSLFKSSVKDRTGLLYSQFSMLGLSVETATKRPTKMIYEAQAITLISSMCLAAATPLESDYKNRNDVLSIIDLLAGDAGVYPIFLSTVDDLQSDNGGDVDSYVPDAASMIALNRLFNFTISSLFKIALGSRQERSFICTEDTNIILLTHRFYGLDPEDVNMDDIMINNNIGLNELLQVRQGRKIVYYV
jgi:hypothetical protein